MPDDTPILEARDLTFRFGGHVAVNAVSCAFMQGTLTAIVGPNGAGKTTFFNLISGQLRPFSGSVILFGRDITSLDAPERARLGLGRAFQLTSLFPHLTVLENVRLAAQSIVGVGFDFHSVAGSDTSLVDEAHRCLKRVKLDSQADSTVAVLAHGDQRKLEVAILLALKPKVFMFDEPTSGMSLEEVPMILDLIDEIKSEGDKTILLVEHKMDVVKRLADRIIVLKDGSVIADGLPADVEASPEVQQAYLGLRSADAPPPEAGQG